MKTGRRVWKCEISTIDTTYLIAGALTAAMYFNRDTSDEQEIRKLANALYARADWHWAQNGALTVTHGWKPERGFIKFRWTGYSEALILYVLGLASPTFPLPEDSYRAWTRNYKWKELYGPDPLRGSVVYHTSRTCDRFRGIQDESRARKLDYFENSRPCDLGARLMRENRRDLLVTIATVGELRLVMDRDRLYAESTGE